MDGQSIDFEFLQQVLRKQLALYRQLVDLLRAEREHVVAVGLKEIREDTYGKEALIDEIQREEAKRRRWLAEAAPLFGFTEAECSLERIAQHKLASAQAETLLSVRQALLHLVRKAQEMNEDNRRLVESALKDAEQLKRNVLGLSSDQPQVYGPRGAMSTVGPDRSARFLSKEA
jgi:flagellar biosynthesis/type III secretory pathway chaperone